MAAIFISYIHEEKTVAVCVQRFLRAILGSSAEPFMSADTWQVYAGERWLDRIVEELKNAKVVLLMLSPESVKRPWVNFEAGAAWVRDIIIIPVCFGGLKKGELPKPYSSLQAVDLMDEDDRYYLANSVAHHLKMLPLLPPTLMRIFTDESEGMTDARKRCKEELEAYESVAKCLEQAFREQLKEPGARDA
ncbi:MAG: toll/interleukin-1 receptor domain-containing protein [Candidatus Acidiferrales bacterium]